MDWQDIVNWYKQTSQNSMPTEQPMEQSAPPLAPPDPASPNTYLGRATSLLQNSGAEARPKTSAPNDLMESAGNEGIFSTQRAVMGQPDEVTKPSEIADRQVSEEPAVKSEEAEAKPSPVTSQSDATKPDISEALHLANNQVGQNQMIANVLRGGQQFLGAAGRTKPDYEVANSLERQAGQPLSQLEGMFKFKDLSQKSTFNNEISDPNSSISKIYQQVAIKNGISPEVVKGATAEQLQKAIGPLVSGSVKEELAKINGGKKDIKEAGTVVAKSRAEIAKRGVDLDELKKARDILQHGIENPNAINDIASFYASAKAFNPKAVVRSQSVKLEQQAMPTWTRLENTINDLTQGKKRLSDTGVQKDMLNAINHLYEISKQDHDLYNQSVLKYAKNQGVPEDRFDEIVPGYSGQAAAPKQPQAASQSQGMVDVVSPEGKKGQIPATSLDEALKRGFTRAQ